MTGEIEQGRLLMKHLCSLWKPCWNYIQMAELLWEGTPRSISDSYQVSCREKRLVYAEAEGLKQGQWNERLRVTLFPAAQRYRQRTVPEEKKGPSSRWAALSAEDIRAHSRILGDHNLLHRGKDPAAGGFLLFETVRMHCPGHSFCRIRFYHAVHAAEEFRVVCGEDRMYVYQKQYLCMLVFWKGESL